MVGRPVVVAPAPVSACIPVLLDALLQLLDLLLKQLPQELAQLVEGDLARLVVIQNAENDLVSLVEVGALVVVRVDALQQTFHEVFYFVLFERSRVICIDCVKYTFVDLAELLLVDEDIRQVLNSLLVVHYYKCYYIWNSIL